MSGSSPASERVVRPAIDGEPGAERKPLDLERGLPTTADDVAALRRIRESRRLTTEEYLQALARLPPLTPEQQAARRHPRGEPFRL